MQTLIEKLTKEFGEDSAEWAVAHAKHALGVVGDLPPSVTDNEGAIIFDVKPATFRVWRCTRDRDIEFAKVGRSVQNKTASVLREFIRSGRRDRVA